MNPKLSFSIACCLAVAAGAAAAAKPGVADTDDPSHASVLQEMRSEARMLTAAVSGGDVGEVDSFGRPVKYMGRAQTSIVSAEPDCTPDPSNPPSKNDRCVTLLPQPQTTSVHEINLAALHLPAGASHSLVCYDLTPFIAYHSINNTSTPTSSRYTFLAEVVVKNDVLKDPALIDPTTGAPFNGQLTVTFSLFDDRREFHAGEQAFKTLRLSRSCGTGLISKDLLKNVYGLNDLQATRFFTGAIDLSFGAIEFLKLQDDVNIFYDVRLYGD